MRIQSLQVSGFKSFLETTSFSFNVPITGIVGPNGCGKSNVVDALKWVTGEMSYKQLRGKNSEDLIFAGSDRRPPSSMMEVALTFDNTEKKASPQYNEFSQITVLRRIFRDGSSEFSINKTPCRLRDITDLFLDTGIGQSSYSIIEQGKVGAIVSGRPEDRRLMIEEAAGITKFKHRKKAALRKIDATKQNLLRVTDIIKEIDKQVASLQRQAKKAQQFKEAKEAFEALDLNLFMYDFENLQAEKLNLLKSEDDQQLQLSQAETDLSTFAADFETKRLDLEKLESSFQESQQALFVQKTEMQGVTHEIESSKHAIAYSEKQWVIDQEKTKTLAEDIERYQSREKEIKEELEAIENNKTSTQKSLEDKEKVFHQNRDQLTDLETKIEKFKKEHIQHVTSLTHARSKVESLSENVSYFEKNMIELESALKDFDQDIEISEEKSLALKKDFDSIQQMCFGFEENQKKIENQIADTEQQKMHLDQDMKTLEQSLREKESRLHALENFTKTYQGYTKTVQSIMKKQEGDHKFSNIQGVLGQMLEIDPGYERCVQAVLSDWIESIVIEDVPTSLDLITYLKKDAKSRAMLLTGRQADPKSENITDKRILGRLSQWAAMPGGTLSGVQDKLNQTFVVGTIEDLIALSQAYPKTDFVSTEGDYLQSSGMLHVGPWRETYGDLEVRSEIQNLREQLKPLKREYADKQEAKQKTVTLFDQLSGQLNHVLGQMEVESSKRSELSLQLQKITDHLGFVSQQKLQKEENIKNLKSRKEEVDLELAKLKSDISDFESSANILEQNIEKENQVYQKQRDDFATYQKDIHAYQLNLTSLLERLESLTRENMQVSQAHTSSSAQKEQLEKQCIEHQENIKKQNEKIVSFESQMQSSLNDFESKENQNKGIKTQHDELVQLIRDLEIRLKKLQSTKEQHVEDVNHMRVSLSEVAVKMEHIQGQVMEMYDKDVFDLLAQDKDSESALQISPDNLSDVRVDREKLKTKVVKFGNVNLAAIEEISEMTERHAFLSEQKLDLETSLNKLDQAIKTINQTTKEKFENTFEEVNHRFQNIFPRLFRGGKARLSLTNPDDILETGVEILAQPPGKKLQNMNLLSGGEKALTAISLLFAIFEFKAPPFCVLDEVDAPLDDANVLRFVAMVKEMSEKTQFIVITHNKGSMQMAQNLYGVTMEEPGVSRTVSVRLEQKNIHDEQQIFEAKSVA